MPAARGRSTVVRWLELIYWLGLSVCACYATGIAIDECPDLGWWMRGEQALLWGLLGYRAYAMQLRDRWAVRRYTALTVALTLCAVFALIGWPAIGLALWSECIGAHEIALWLILLAGGSLLGALGAMMGLMCGVSQEFDLLPRRPLLSLENFAALPQVEFQEDEWAALEVPSIERPILNEPTCIVCLEAYAAGERIKFLRCGHHYHSECLQGWLCLRVNCPTCRAAVAQI